MAQFGSRFHASRNERIASGLAKAYIIWKPWSKNACASLFDEEIGRVNVPRPVLNISMGCVLRSNTVFGAALRALFLRRTTAPTEREEAREASAISHSPPGVAMVSPAALNGSIALLPAVRPPPSHQRAGCCAETGPYSLETTIKQITGKARGRIGVALSTWNRAPCSTARRRAVSYGERRETADRH